MLHTDGIPEDAHFFDDLGADSMVMAQFCARVRRRADLPTVSIKDVYAHPTISRLTAALAPAAGGSVDAVFAEVLGEVLHTDGIPEDAHFFDDLGADSMVMAQFCARVRKRADLPTVSIKDVYAHPTISRLTAALAPAAPAPVADAPAPVDPPASPPRAAASTSEYVLCGVMQFLTFLGYAYVLGLFLAWSYGWVHPGSGLLDTYLRVTIAAGGAFLIASTLPILAKWLLIGRWKPQRIRIWSLTYYRFWVVKTLVRANPLAPLLLGTPLFPLYLRALGARVGRNVLIQSLHVPVATDLLTIGEGTVIRKDSSFTCYRAHAGGIYTGTVTLGRNVLIGEKTVLDIDTAMGDGAQLGHSSSLHAGMSVPMGERWHGSPAQRTDLDYIRVAPAHCSRLRRVGFSAVVLLKIFFLYLPLTYGAAFLYVALMPSLETHLEPGLTAVTTRHLYLEALAASAVLYFGGLIVGLLVITTVPRLLNRFLEPDKTYPLYGIHYAINRAVGRMTNVRAFTYLLGDSSYIVHYLKGVGYNLNRIIQTGVNFGMDVKHDNPYLTSVGSGSMVADGLVVMNADYSDSSFRVSQASIGAHNFLGNLVFYPSGGRTGDNCLLATKVMVPLDGRMREGVGLLGSPPFEIPRSVARDNQFDHVRAADHLPAKNRYDIRTLGAVLLVRWLLTYLLLVLGMIAVHTYGEQAHVGGGAFIALSLLGSAVYWVLVERVMTKVRPLEPSYCSIYDPYFWWQERVWKTPSDTYFRAFDGTPFKCLIWRLLGVRIGKRVFDDGLYVTERQLAAIGDDCTFNAGSYVWCHSQEDGAFKADRTTIGARCTVGVGALVHYGVEMQDDATLEADSYLMKGEEVPPHTRWGGNPAEELEQERAAGRVHARVGG